MGGAHWGGVAYDPWRRIAVVPVNRVAAYVQVFPRELYDALVAVSLASGKKIWEVPLGTTRDFFASHIGLPLAIRWGTPNLGGPIVTASGIVFVAAAMDDYLRAFDVETGRELWRGRLPAGAQATPMTYRLEKAGRQFVVVAAGGHGRLGTDRGDYAVAFALPAPRSR
jgi:quinoprotein glucose dehydrogenase